MRAADMGAVLTDYKYFIFTIPLFETPKHNSPSMYLLYTFQTVLAGAGPATFAELFYKKNALNKANV